jgi:hypothetical protein
MGDLWAALTSLPSSLEKKRKDHLIFLGGSTHSSIPLVLPKEGPSSINYFNAVKGQTLQPLAK